MEGILVIDKPNGLTSHDCVSKVRRRFNIKKVGHAGTLDPLATGVLVMLLGKSTKLFDQFVAFDKAYRATIQLGVRTTTADTQGEVIGEHAFDHVTEEMIEETLKDFTGEIEQVPPMYSAVKHKGKKLYELARKGIEVKREPRRITISKLTIESYQAPYLRIYMECSKGTYVRQLAEDLGERLGCGGCITEIQRTKVGHFNLEDAVTLENIDESHIRNWQS